MISFFMVSPVTAAPAILTQELSVKNGVKLTIINSLLISTLCRYFAKLDKNV